MGSVFDFRDDGQLRIRIATATASSLSADERRKVEAEAVIASGRKAIDIDLRETPDLHPRNFPAAIRGDFHPDYLATASGRVLTTVMRSPPEVFLGGVRARQARSAFRRHSEYKRRSRRR